MKDLYFPGCPENEKPFCIFLAALKMKNYFGFLGLPQK
jgi:hypothetical protein